MNYIEVLKDYPNYSVNSLGEVYSIRRDKILKPYINHRGYEQVRLYNKAGSKMFTVHRLVAEMFLPNPNKLPFINHKDGDKQHNHLDNLEWCTAQENTDHAMRNGKFKSKLTDTDVFNIRYLAATSSLTHTEIAKRLGITRMMVWRTVNNKSWTHI